MKRTVMLVLITCFLFTMLVACGPISGNTPGKIMEQSENTPGTTFARPDGNLTWNEFVLIREDYYGRSEDAFIQENVLTTEDQTLTVLFLSGFGNDNLEYGVTEVIQVNLDGNWYTLATEPENSEIQPVNLSLRDKPLILPPFSMPVEEAKKTEYTVDLSVFGRLPTGRYRFVERFFLERLQLELHALAYFWVVEPGEDSPPESMTGGTARLEDIVFFVASLYEARQVITDADTMLALNIENLSGRQYIESRAVLEMQQGSQWVGVAYRHANLGLLQSWVKDRNVLFLEEPLSAGNYRLRLEMNVFGTQSGIEAEYEFIVYPYNETSEPGWVKSRLRVSPNNTAQYNGGVTITLDSDIMNTEKQELKFVLTADNNYSYGESFGIEVLLDGVWYSVPFANGAFNSIGYSIDQNTDISKRTHIINPVFAVGILPAGYYRLTKEFDLVGPDTTEWGGPVYLEKVTAFAEFTVEETIEWLG